MTALSAKSCFLDNWRTLSEELKLHILEYAVTLGSPCQARLPCYYHLDDHRYWKSNAFCDLIIPLLSVPEIKSLVQGAFYSQHSFSLDYNRKWNTDSRSSSLSVYLPWLPMRKYVRRLHMAVSGIDQRKFELLNKAPIALANLPNLSLLEISLWRLLSSNDDIRKCLDNWEPLGFKVKCLRIAFRQYRMASPESADIFETALLEKFMLAAGMGEVDSRWTRFVVSVPDSKLCEVESWAATASIEHNVRWTTKEVVAKEHRHGRYPKFQPDVDQQV